MHGIDVLIEKLDEFIRKYYKNRLLKGLIYSSALLCSFLAYLSCFSLHRTLKLIWTLLTALGVLEGISLKENILDQLFSLVHDIDELSKYLSEFFQFGHFILKEPLWEQNSSSVLFGLF